MKHGDKDNNLSFLLRFLSRWNSSKSLKLGEPHVVVTCECKNDCKILGPHMRNR